MIFWLKLYERNIQPKWTNRLISLGYFNSNMACILLTSCLRPIRLHGFFQVGGAIYQKFDSACWLRRTLCREFNQFSEELGLFHFYGASNLWIQQWQIMIKSLVLQIGVSYRFAIVQWFEKLSSSNPVAALKKTCRLLSKLFIGRSLGFAAATTIFTTLASRWQISYIVRDVILDDS